MNVCLFIMKISEVRGFGLVSLFLDQGTKLTERCKEIVKFGILVSVYEIKSALSDHLPIALSWIQVNRRKTATPRAEERITAASNSSP